MRVPSKFKYLRPGDRIYLGGVLHYVKQCDQNGFGRRWKTILTVRRNQDQTRGYGLCSYRTLTYNGELPVYRWKSDDVAVLEYEGWIVVAKDRDGQPRGLDKACSRDEQALASIYPTKRAAEVQRLAQGYQYGHPDGWVVQRVLLRYANPQ